MRKITARILGLAAISMLALASLDPQMRCCTNPGNPGMSCCKNPLMKCCHFGAKHHMTRAA